MSPLCSPFSNPTASKIIFGGTVRKQDKQRAVVSINSCLIMEYFFGLKNGKEMMDLKKKW